MAYLTVTQPQSQFQNFQSQPPAQPQRQPEQPAQPQPIRPSVQSGNFQCPDDFGFYAHHKSCDKYWACDNGNYYSSF